MSVLAKTVCGSLFAHAKPRSVAGARAAVARPRAPSLVAHYSRPRVASAGEGSEPPTEVDVAEERGGDASPPKALKKMTVAELRKLASSRGLSTK